MRTYFRKHLVLSVFGLFMAGCAVITVNIYFPTEAVQKAAEDILNEIEADETTNPLDLIEGEIESEIEDNEQQSYMLKEIKNFVLGNQIVYAEGENIDIHVTTPAIRKVISSMRTRNRKIRGFKQKGIIGETSLGKLEIRDFKSVGGSEIRIIKQLLKAENSDRDSLYKELAIANNISESDIQRIRDVFGKTHKRRLKTGDWYKGEDGKWKKKD